MVTSTVLELTTTARYVMTGGRPLEGRLVVQGAKNAALPMIAAAVLVKKGQTILRNVPPLNDIQIQIALVESSGAKIAYDEAERVLVIDASSVWNPVLNSNLTTRSRASILMLPSLLHRLSQVEFHGIGGCSLGMRRLDFHHNGFKRLGATVEGDHDDLTIKADQLKGNVVYLDIPSQTSTENLMMAACLAQGKTIIENAACEPEVVDFARFLTKMGATLHGAGTGTITIEGVQELNATEHVVMPDRLDAGPFMIAAAITNGDVSLEGARLDQMRILVAKLQQMGVHVEADGPFVRVKGAGRLRPVNAVSWPYPGFSTDFLPAMMSLAALSEGTSFLRENVFEDRLTQVEGLNSLGARITKENSSLARIDGVKELRGDILTAPDLRAGMAFVLAGLAAQGETEIQNAYQIERGHSDVDIRLQNLGANIIRFTH